MWWSVMLSCKVDVDRNESRADLMQRVRLVGGKLPGESTLEKGRGRKARDKLQRELTRLISSPIAIPSNDTEPNDRLEWPTARFGLIFVVVKMLCGWPVEECTLVTIGH